MKTKVIIAMLLVQSFVVMGGRRNEKLSEEHLAQLISKNYLEREKASQTVLESRRSVITELERIVKKFTVDDTRAGTAKTAIVLLGKLRSSESVPLLSEKLDFEAFYKSTKRPQPPEDLYPCVGALSVIGKPSIPAMIKNIESHRDEKVRKLSAIVILNVEGHDLARVVVSKAMEKQKDPEKKANLEKSLAYFNG